MLCYFNQIRCLAFDEHFFDKSAKRMSLKTIYMPGIIPPFSSNSLLHLSIRRHTHTQSSPAWHISL